MSPLPPLADLVGFSDPDPRLVDRVEEKLRSSGRFENVWRPADGWVAGMAPLPGSPVVPEAATQVGLAFAQGADLALGNDTRSGANRVVELAERGVDRLHTLPGDFGFVHFRDHGHATVVRACGGPVPFYLAGDERWRAVATRLEDLAAVLLGEVTQDPLVHATWNAGYGWFPDDRSPLAGVQVLPRGHAAVFGAEGAARWVRYWDPRPDRLDPVGSLPGHAAELRRLLLATLERDLDADGGNLLTLSGGLDSSCLAAVIAGTLGLPLASLSFVPTHEPSRRELEPRIERVVRAHGIRPSAVLPLSTQHRLELLSAGPRLLTPVLHPVLNALPAFSAEHDVRVMVGGECADTVCGARLTFGDWAAHTSPRRLLTREYLPTGPRDRLRWLRRRARATVGRVEVPAPADIHEMFQSSLREEYREWRHRLERRARDDRRPRPGLALQLASDGWLAMNWEVCSMLGIRRSVPFFSREVLELASRCHPADLIGPGTKRLLRTALRDDVPTDVLSTHGKGVSSPVGPPPRYWEPPPLADLAQLVSPDWPPADHTYSGSDALVLTQLGRTAAAVSAQETLLP